MKEFKSEKYKIEEEKTIEWKRVDEKINIERGKNDAKKERFTMCN